MKKEKNKKILIALASIIILGLVICALCVLVLPKVSSEEAEGIDDDEIKILNDNYPSDIIVYGEKIEFSAELNFRTITEISEDNLISDSKYKYTFFVINDREGKLNISDNEFELCKKMCDEYNMNFFYIGEQYLTHLKDFGFYNNLYMEDILGIGYVISPYGHTTIQGFWSSTEEEHYSNNNELLGQVLIYAFVDNVIKMVN